MSISPGTHLGPYEIITPLGAGGMGEVYRARDPRMGREVAIKVSGERFSDRFEREVRAVASLNHPNICHIYDVGPNYLVMELVEGAALAARIETGAIRLDEALRIAHQIGDALEAAHDKGIVHRDLKPANIMLTPDGGVKVLDFGLAKIAEHAAPAGCAEQSPTVAMGATIAGQIMGTAAYMAPEQARGKTVDKRADIWAFGVVLYEMLTGHRMFEGETVSDVLAGVLTREPDLTRVPIKARRLLLRCLEKDPKRRLRDIGDARDLLEEAPTDPAAKGIELWKAAAAIVLTIAATSIWWAWRAARTPEATSQPLVQLDLDLGSGTSFAATSGPAAIISPDGARLVFISEAQDGVHRLFTRRLDQGKASPLPKTDGAYGPFFSPDGQWIGFFGRGKLMKIFLDGGEPIPLCDAANGRGGTWAEGGNIIAALDSQTGLSQVSVAGGRVTPLTDLARGEISHRWPYALPGGKAVVFNNNSAWGNHTESGIAVVSLADHKWKPVLERAGMYPRYLPSGHLAYVANGTLLAAPFDLNRLEVRGPATPVMEDLSENTHLGFAHLDFSRGGTMVFRKGRSETQSTIQWLDSTGKTEPLLSEPAQYEFPRISPDGSRLAFLVNEGSGRGVWIYDWQRGGKYRLTSAVSSFPVWSPDGTYLVFQMTGGMFWARADGAGQPQPLTDSKDSQFPGSFTSDGTLVFTELIPGVGSQIRTVKVESRSLQLYAGKRQAFLKVPTYNAYPSFSPNGRWLAYASTEAGIYEVYVRAFPDNGSQVLISNAGGLTPIWSPNGHELFYRTEDQRIMVVNYKERGESFLADKPRVWSGTPLANMGQTPNFDLGADGKRLVVLMPSQEKGPIELQNHLMLALNFFDEVRRRVGQGK